MIEVQNLGRDFTKGASSLTVLTDINLTIGELEFVAITGHSGSGKSTLLGLLAGLDQPSRGSITVDGVEITGLDEDSLSELRGRKMGFVFQSFQLIPTLTALENVQVPAEILGDASARDRAAELLERVGLSDRASHYPGQLSGGEMQRVALARAAVTQPKILFADEPTGNLDSANGDIVMDMLLQQNRDCTLVLVTHNPQLAALADREIRLKDGRIHEIVVHKKNGAKPRAKVVKKSTAKKQSANAARKKSAAKGKGGTKRKAAASGKGARAGKRA
ncbi:MAG: ABC transporter ATP-binding protein [bacterium]|nr:ABC transporter ATP-binding protein [bacterium]